MRRVVPLQTMGTSDNNRTDQPGVFFLDESGRPELLDTAASPMQQKPRQTNYAAAEQLARQTFRLRDPAAQARRCGARAMKSCGGETLLHLDFLGRPLAVAFPNGEVTDPAGGGMVPVWERILILHYLGGDSPAPELSDLVGFAEVPSGGFYLDAFKRRAHHPLARWFGQRPKLLLEAGRTLGATPEDFGDAAVRVLALPRVPVVAVVHGADPEFPADAKMLFESSITAFFCTEDIAVLGGMVAGRLVKAARSCLGGHQP